jgi:hypothetical protein
MSGKKEEKIAKEKVVKVTRKSKATPTPRSPTGSPRKVVALSPRTTEMRDSISEFYSSRPDFLPTSISFFYFIGRLNPPHNGHIAALYSLIIMARDDKSFPLILLGNGPQSKSCSIDQQTTNKLDNPIDFELKKEFIQYKLQTYYGIEPTTYLIVEMGSPAKQVSNYITFTLEQPGLTKNINEVKIYHVAGDKDGDTTKLDFIKPIAINTARPLISQLERIVTETIGIPAITEGTEEMSATKVRLSVYEGILKENPGIFMEKYGAFYGDYADRIYDTIARVGQEVRQERLIEYIKCKDPSVALGIKNKSRKRGKRENRYRSSKKPKRQTKGSRHRKTKRR